MLKRLLLLFNIFFNLLCFSQSKFSNTKHCVEPLAPIPAAQIMVSQDSNCISISNTGNINVNKSKIKMPASADYLVNTYYAENENLHLLISDSSNIKIDDLGNRFLKQVEELADFINKFKSECFNIENRLKRLEQNKKMNSNPKQK